MMTQSHEIDAVVFICIQNSVWCYRDIVDESSLVTSLSNF